MTSAKDSQELGGLLPCPFCGGTNLVSEKAIYGYGHSIGCDDCSASLWSDAEPPLNSKVQAREAWNRRSPFAPSSGAALAPVQQAELMERCVEIAREHLEIDGDNEGEFIRSDSIEAAVEAILAASLYQLHTRLADLQTEEAEWKEAVQGEYNRAEHHKAAREAAEAMLAEALTVLDDEIAAYSNPAHDCVTNRAVLIALNHVRARSFLSSIAEKGNGSDSEVGK